MRRREFAEQVYRQLWPALAATSPASRATTPEDMARKHQRFLADYAATLPLLTSSLARRRMLAQMTVKGDVPSDDSGQGFIVVATHSGRFDQGAALLRELVDRPVVIPVRRLSSIAKKVYFDHSRRSVGLTVLPEASLTSAALTERLRNGEVIVLTLDRPGSDSGHRIRWFDRSVPSPSTPARLSALTGRPLIPVHIHEQNGRQCAHLGVPLVAHPTMEVQATQSLADTLTRAIANAPWEWHLPEEFIRALIPAARVVPSPSHVDEPS